MAKKSYLGQLGRWFVRSAVGQVGRDGGRVISNQIYGDAHSTPIRGVGETPVQAPPLPGNEQQVGSFEYVPSDNNLLMWIVAMVLTCGLAAIIAFFKGLHISNKGTVTYRRYETEQVPIIDRRYKTGVRGYTTQAGYKTYEIPLVDANLNDVQHQKKAGRNLMVSSCVVLAILLCAAIGIKPSGNLDPVLFFTVPLFVSYVYVLWKPSTLDFIGGSNATRRIIATVVFVLLYGAAFVLHEKYAGQQVQPKTEMVTDSVQ